MLRKLKKIMAICTILILLPYVITVFINGKSIGASQNQVLDDYCIYMLAKEVSSDYEDEMLKAQAVIVRTTVYKNIKEIDMDAFEQTKIDKAWYRKLKKIWKETEGQVLMYNGELALLPFHQLSNGQTRSGKEVLGSDAYPYLQVTDCIRDLEADMQIHIQTVPVEDVQVVSKDSAGYAMEVKVGEEVCSGDNFRDTYDLISSCFEVKAYDGHTRVITHGMGHGLGLSQNTANEMAKDGKGYKEILQYFFAGTEMKEVAEILWDTE